MSASKMVVPSRLRVRPSRKSAETFVEVTGLDHKVQARFPDAVFIVGEQGLGDAQFLGHLPLGKTPLLAEQGQGTGKIRVHTITYFLKSQRVIVYFQ